MKHYFLKQCRLEKVVNRSKKLMTTWIPEKYAIKGKIIDLKEKFNDGWSNGWKVENVGREKKALFEVKERGRDYRRTREASDI